MAIAARTREGSSFTLLGDERLARLAAAGHERAFAVVYQRYHQPLYRYCRSILRNDADAQDALQSTFAAAFAALGRGQRDAPIRPWLFRIAYNEAVSALRRRRPTAELSAASGACTTSTEDRVAERAELRMLLRDLHKLSERQRSALVMRELSGLSHEEIAIALGTSVGTAKQTIYEARRSLFEFAEGREMPCDEIRRTISDADGRALRGRRVRAHLRECEACAEFAAAISERRAELRALAPALPTAAAAGLLEHIVGAGSGHGAGAGLVGLATATAGKTAAAALTTNALAGMAVVAGATGGGRRARPGHRSWPRVAQDGARSTRGARATHSTRGPSAQIPGGRAAGPEAGAGQTAHDRGPRRPADGRILRTWDSCGAVGDPDSSAPGALVGSTRHHDARRHPDYPPIRPDHHTGVPSAGHHTPGRHTNGPGPDVTESGEDTPRPGQEGHRPRHDATGPGQETRWPEHHRGGRSAADHRPGRHATGPGEDTARPGQEIRWPEHDAGGRSAGDH